MTITITLISQVNRAVVAPWKIFAKEKFVKHCRNLLRAAFITRVHKARGAFIHKVKEFILIITHQKLREQITFHTEKL